MNKATTSYRFDRSSWILRPGNCSPRATGGVGRKGAGYPAHLIERCERLVTKDELLELVCLGSWWKRNTFRSRSAPCAGPWSANDRHHFGARVSVRCGARYARRVARGGGRFQPSTVFDRRVAVLNTEGDPRRTTSPWHDRGHHHRAVRDGGPLAVTRRNSTFRFKGQAVDTQQIGRDWASLPRRGRVRRMGIAFDLPPS